VLVRPRVEHMCYTGGMDKFWTAINELLNPTLPPKEPTIDWDVSPAERRRVMWSFASLADCTYEEAVDQLSYMTYADAKEFLGEEF
jgi:hypothetical protein